MGLPRWLGGKESTCQCRRCKRCGLDPWVRKIPGVGNGNPPQCSCLENSMDRGTWQSTVYGVKKVGHEWAIEHTLKWWPSCIEDLHVLFLKIHDGGIKRQTLNLRTAHYLTLESPTAVPYPTALNYSTLPPSSITFFLRFIFHIVSPRTSTTYH